VALFKEALNLPPVAELTEPAACPLCGTDSALTPERVHIIRHYVATTSDFNTAETAAKTALGQLSASASTLAEATTPALPGFLRVTSAKRREKNFTVVRLRQLLGDRAAAVVDPWLARIIYKTPRAGRGCFAASCGSRAPSGHEANQGLRRSR
jgi:hypothetical protein